MRAAFVFVEQCARAVDRFRGDIEKETFPRVLEDIMPIVAIVPEPRVFPC